MSESTSRPAFGFPAAPASVLVRPPARAGQFYPAEMGPMHTMVDRFLGAAHDSQAPCRAVMLPHAGWIYCGSTLGKTLAQVDLPDTLIILGPKHTPLGPDLSIASHHQWAIPGGSVAIATDIVRRLTELLPALPCESEAHRMEHGSEVLLPFLVRSNPFRRVAPIVVGQLDYASIAIFGQALAIVLREAESRGQRVGLVISSDMNHFAPEAENRRLDDLALQAMMSGEPRRLYDTCQQHQISMCGMIPAAIVMEALRQMTPAIAPRLVDYTTSGQASGDYSRVVGYAGVVIA